MPSFIEDACRNLRIMYVGLVEIRIHGHRNHAEGRGKYKYSFLANGSLRSSGTMAK